MGTLHHGPAYPHTNMLNIIRVEVVKLMYISRTREGLNKEFGIFILRSTVLKMEFILFETTSKMASNKRMWYQPKYKIR